MPQLNENIIPPATAAAASLRSVDGELSSPEPSTPALRAHGEPVGASLPPILVADDDADDLYFAVRTLRKTGTAHPVKSFTDGAEIVEYLKRQLASGGGSMPRLLFLDLKMVGLGGFAFLEWIRGQRAFSGLHIVVLTGSSNPEDMERARQLGAKRYLVKHPSLSTFATIVQSVYPSKAFDRAPAPARILSDFADLSFA